MQTKDEVLHFAEIEVYGPEKLCYPKLVDQGMKYVGCFRDSDTNGRDFGRLIGTTMPLANCIRSASNLGFKYAGL